MGSLSSRPKVPANTAPQVVFVPSSTNTGTVAASASSQSTGGDTGSAAEGNDAGNSAESRTESLLRRNRGRLGTVLTGLSGVLNPVRSEGQKKTLLGE